MQRVLTTRAVLYEWTCNEPCQVLCQVKAIHDMGRLWTLME